MKTIQEYIDRYKKIAQNLGYSGQSVEILVQLLSQASFISEVENASYMAEASLEKCSLINSKIQHCVDRMYSVFRGSCPRVVMKIKPTKYLTLNPYDKIIESSNFTVHYLGYYQVVDKEGNIVRGDNGISSDSGKKTDAEILESRRAGNTTSTGKIIDSTLGRVSSNTGDEEGTTDNNSSVPDETIDELLKYSDYTGNWQYSSATFYPVISGNSGVQIIIGFIAPKRSGEKLTIEKTISKDNTYYVDCRANNLSDDMYVEIGAEGEDSIEMRREDRTRIFAEHILDHKIFDLTLPGFGSRLYLANFYKDTVVRNSNDIEGITENAKVKAQYYGFSKLTDYTDNELKRLQFKGAELLPFLSWTDDNGISNVNAFLSKEGLSETSSGLCYIPEVARDDVGTIHYKANRDRYVNSILRSNSDIGTVLEESFPELIISGGTSYLFSQTDSEKKNSTIDIYYIPKNEEILLSDSEIENFKREKRAYYVITTEISILPGTRYVATFNVDLDLYKNSGENDFNVEVGQNILVGNYEKKFDVVFDDSCKKDIESLINKISNVKRINDLTVSYTDPSGRPVSLDTSKAGQYYFDIKYSITTKVTQES